MDHQRDAQKFRNLIVRLCETMNKPVTDELLESWWKALRHVDFETVSDHVDRFLARADDATRFPRPSQMRPKEMVPRENDGRNHARDYWRSCIVNDCCRYTGCTPDGFEQVMEDNAAAFTDGLRILLDELCAQEMQSGRTEGMHRGCRRQCEGMLQAYGVKELTRA